MTSGAQSTVWITVVSDRVFESPTVPQTKLVPLAVCSCMLYPTKDAGFSVHSWGSVRTFSQFVNTATRQLNCLFLGGGWVGLVQEEHVVPNTRRGCSNTLPINSYQLFPDLPNSFSVISRMSLLSLATLATRLLHESNRLPDQWPQMFWGMKLDINKL